MKTIRIGTRRSQLALWQANYVLDRLQSYHSNHAFELVHFTTEGDRVLDKPLPEIGGKGLFTLELENALRDGEIDLAVHSLKDLPTEMPEGFTLGAIPERATPFDALISRYNQNLDDLVEKAVIGTSSLRRGAQLRLYRPDFRIKPLRGNVDTRIKKALDPTGEYDAVILAAAGLERLGKQDVITEVLPTSIMLPAPGQGAIGIQCRLDDALTLPVLAVIDHAETRACVTAERAFLQQLEAGCRLPVSAYAILEGDQLHLSGRVSDLSGEETITVSGSGDVKNAFEIGAQVAAAALQQGAAALLAAVKQEYPS